jgi:uncharacterized RDD family membrane protein YckC
MEANNEQTINDRKEDLLAEEAYIDNHFVYATQGQRFLNWLIDNALIRFGLNYVSGLAAGSLLTILFPEFMTKIAYGENQAGLYIIVFFVVALDYIFYYTLCEKLFKGYTLGKLITGTRAIRQDGGELTFRNALLRSLSRCVPFEVFSGFSTLTWHDSWTDTMVIKAR